MKPSDVMMGSNDELVDRVPDARLQQESPAHEVLESALAEMKDRAKTYDCPGGERSMLKATAMFNALTELNMSEEQGWKFMVCLKLVRSEQGDHRPDNFVDGAAYFALAGETAGKY